MIFICKICNCKFSSKKALTSHIKKIHNITNKHYYDNYIKKNINEDKCPVCSNNLRFISIYKGYVKYCKGCVLKTGKPQKKLKGKEKTLEHKNKISKTIKELWNNENSLYNTTEYKEKHSIITSNNWKDENSVFNTNAYRNKLSKSLKGNNNGMFGKQHTQKTKLLMSNTHRPDLYDYKEKYPNFYKIEKPIKNKNTDEYIKIKVKCKYCKKWFTPKPMQLQSRIYAIEKDNGNDGLYLYCSKECKDLCPLYRLRPEFNIKNHINEKNYTANEYQQFREYVLERDNYECQYCGNKAEHVHHERPQKLEPFYSLDPDYAWSTCSKCHYEKGHKDNCNTNKLSNIICKGE